MHPRLEWEHAAGTEWNERGVCMSELAQYMVPIIAFLVTLREGVIVWALKLSAGIGCLAGIFAIYIFQDLTSGLRTLLSVGIGCYLLLYVLAVYRDQKKNNRESGQNNEDP